MVGLGRWKNEVGRRTGGDGRGQGKRQVRIMGGGNGNNLEFWIRVSCLGLDEKRRNELINYKTMKGGIEEWME